MFKSLSALFLMLVVAPATAQQDILILKDGRAFDNARMEVAAGGYKLTFEHGGVFVPDDLIEGAYLADGGAQEYQPQNESEREKLARGLVPFRGKWMNEGKRKKELDKFIKQMRAEIADMDAHKEWRDRYKVKTKYFNFEHTLPPHVFARYSRTMEAYFAAFCKEWKVKPQKGYADNPKETRLKVCFYRDEGDFHQVSGANSNVLGYFRFVKPLELDIYYDRLSDEDSTEVMFHEANHYLQKLINVKFSYPHFPGESLAEYYGASHWNDETESLETGLILEGRLTEVQTEMAKGIMMDIEELITTERMYQHYTWGWTLVHFLMSDKRYAKKFKKFYVGLAHDKKVPRKKMGIDGLSTLSQEDVLPVFMRYLGIKNMEELQELEAEWHEYVKHELEVTSSHGLEKAAENALRYNRKLRAKRLYQEAIDTGEASALAYHRYADFLVNGGADSSDVSGDEIEGLWRKAIELDPLTGRFYAALGWYLQEHNQIEEGQRLMRLAVDIEPDDREVAKTLERMRKGGDD